MTNEESDDLRATAADLIADAERLKRIEERKIQLPPDDPQFDELSDESEELVRSMVPKTRMQKQMRDGS